MKFKVDCGKKKVMNNLKKISNNVMVNNFVFELINHDSITNFFCNENHYFFKNNRGDYIAIYFGCNGIIVKSIMEGIDQILQYDKTNNNSKVILNISNEIKWPNHIEKRSVLFFALYGNDGLSSYEITTNCHLESTDEEINENLKNNIYDHYKITSLVNVVDDKLIKVETIDYPHNYKKNDINYSIADYDKDSFEDIEAFVKPKFVCINEEKYNLLKKGTQKIKTMV